MLYLIGLGLRGEKSLTLEALDALRECDNIFLEGYTGVLPELNLDKLEELIGRKVIVLKREDVESGFLEKQKGRVALLVQGDPLSATTHSLMNAKVIHNASIFTAVAETGLHLYKFGKVVSIPFWGADSFNDVINENISINAHTLILLDLDPVNSKFLSVGEAFDRLLKNRNIDSNSEVVVVSRMGCKDCKIKFGSIKKLREEVFNFPCAIIIPSELHFSELEVLERFK